MRRRRLTVGAGVAAVFVPLAVWAVARGAEAPVNDLVFVQEVPADVRRESEVTWRRFTERFAARRSCWGPVSVELVGDVTDGDARYLTGSRRIEIQIPTTPGRYRESLAHELAHHLERTCPDFDEVRALLHPMLADSGQGWFDGPVWDAVPSERFAEAVVELVNGERIRHESDVQVDPTVVELLERWGNGTPIGSRR